MKSNESAENYLETILTLSNRLPVVRSIDIVHELGYTKASVSIAMKNLRENGYITVTDEGYIKLTETGLEIARMIFDRHTTLTNWLTGMGVPEDIASRDACRIEHVISKESIEAIKRSISVND